MNAIFSDACIIPLIILKDFRYIQFNLGATYGGQRIFGDVGFSIANYAAGVACDHYEFEGMSQYTPVFYMVLVYILLTVPVGFYLIERSQGGKETDEV